jgi:hypothetical protein|tara:strand:- start:732 stop:854 length:123 start_codon:yes stop_codon:yes gene_type:complete
MNRASTIRTNPVPIGYVRQVAADFKRFVSLLSLRGEEGFA